MKKKKTENKQVFENGAMVHVRNTDKYGFTRKSSFYGIAILDEVPSVHSKDVYSPTGNFLGTYRESDLEPCSLQEIIAYVAKELRKEIKEQKKPDQHKSYGEEEARYLSEKWAEKWRRMFGI